MGNVNVSYPKNTKILNDNNDLMANLFKRLPIWVNQQTGYQKKRKAQLKLKNYPDFYNVLAALTDFAITTTNNHIFFY